MTITPAQMSYLRRLMRDLGYDEQDLEIDVERLSKAKASKLIEELDAELNSLGRW